MTVSCYYYCYYVGTGIKIEIFSNKQTFRKQILEIDQAKKKIHQNAVHTKKYTRKRRNGSKPKYKETNNWLEENEQKTKHQEQQSTVLDVREVALVSQK